MSLTVRPRRREDLPGLGADLLEQQPHTRYPLRNPLPIPITQFLHAEDALGALVAERDGDVIGHVCWVGPSGEFPDAQRMHRACAEAADVPVDQLAWVSALFTAERGRGAGAGRLLLEGAVTAIRAIDRVPCLEVLPHHGAARQLYLKSGWRDVTTIRPPWLTSVVGDDGPDVHVMVHAPAGGEHTRQPA
ncbi:GNAT family N-acetyltransferase [Ornithinimicrobium faecis]|uniref:GNAT family N-acetyltransferase n=1 Tax=Ornithinimicrobium faecis TaxID=2934158 RepID=UPI002118283A|nr:GNAT family N-acetyltransferase [Ornithinimicrobium sp. HY1745]